MEKIKAIRKDCTWAKKAYMQVTFEPKDKKLIMDRANELQISAAALIRISVLEAIKDGRRLI